MLLHLCSRGFSSGRRRPPPPSRVPARMPPAAPAHPPPAPSAVGAAQPRQPGLMGQMAATAVGVGVGSAVVSSFYFYSPVCESWLTTEGHGNGEFGNTTINVVTVKTLQCYHAEVVVLN